MNESPILLEVKDLKKHFPIQKGVLKRVVGQVGAVDGVSFFIRQGETLGLVGESGVRQDDHRPRDLCVCSIRLRARSSIAAQRQHGRSDAHVSPRDEDLSPRKMQIIFQDPFSSLNPRMTVMEIISELLIIHQVASGDEIKVRVRELLEQVGMRVQHMNRYPYVFSGGQRQRIGTRWRSAQPEVHRLRRAGERAGCLDSGAGAQPSKRSAKGSSGLLTCSSRMISRSRSTSATGSP